jgi:hypothetical protein
MYVYNSMELSSFLEGVSRSAAQEFHILEYRPVARQPETTTQQPLLGNSFVNTQEYWSRW